MHFSRFVRMLSALVLLNACTPTEVVQPFYSSEQDFINDTTTLTRLELVGKKIFFDKNLSNPVGISCASCHAPLTGFSDPEHSAFSKGVLGLLGNRNSPTISYLAFSPQQMYFDNIDSAWVGGFFHDGRASSLEKQLLEPVFSHIEMNMNNIAAVIDRINRSAYRADFVSIFGEAVFSDSLQFIQSFQKAVVAFEKSNQVSPFTSKFDYYLKGKVQLTRQEMRGLILFNDPEKGNCSACHPSSADEISGKVLFTDFTYDNIGLPPNPNQSLIPDFGLGITKNSSRENGKFKVPTLRNIEKTAPYFHNGVIQTLEDAIRFYSERDIVGKFNSPEVVEDINKDELGNLKLTTEEINDIKAFLLTLTDGYQP